MMLSVSFSMPELLIAPPPLEAELPERVLSETETVPKLQMAPPPYHSKLALSEKVLRLTVRLRC